MGTVGDSRAGDESQHARLACLVLGLVTILAYLPVQFFDFSYYDDYDYLTHNPTVQGGLSWAGIQWAFTSLYASNWHPVTWLSHMLDWELFGANAGAQHLVNVLLHAANAMLFLTFWYRTTRRLWPSALAAALFAWHPLRVESVAWIAERKDVLSTFFGLLCLLAYASYVEARENSSTQKSASGQSARPRSGRSAYLLALLFFAAGLMAKPMLVTWPFVLLLLDYWPFNRFQNTPSSEDSSRAWTVQWRRLVLEKWPFFLLILPACVITVLAQRPKAILPLQVFPVWLRFSNALLSYVRYLRKSVWPDHLALSYPFPHYCFLWQLVLAAALLLGISAWAWRRRRREPFWWMGWLWYLGTLVPVIGLVQVGSESMADRYTYIPLMGPVVAIAFGAFRFLQRTPLPRAYVTATCGLALGALLALTQMQLMYWQNCPTLFGRVVALNHRNPLGHQVLGSFFFDQGQTNRALEEFRIALDIIDSGPDVPTKLNFSVHGHQALAHNYEQQKLFPQALAQYDILLREAPDNVEVHNDLANLLADLGRREEAVAHYRKAIRLNPDSPTPHENLGSLFEESGEFDQSVREFREAARLAPRDGRPRQLLGMDYLRQGDRPAAVAQFRQALDLDTNDLPSMACLARILAADVDPAIRNETEALHWAETARDLTAGREPFVLDALAMAYANTDQYDAARKAAEAALQLARAAGHASTASNIQTRLDLYATRKPYREKFRLESRPVDLPQSTGERRLGEASHKTFIPPATGTSTAD